MRRNLTIFTSIGLILILLSIWLAGGILGAPCNRPVGDLPSDLVGKSVEFSSLSGSTLHGWLIPGSKGRGSIILMHGVRANRLSMLERARFLSQTGYSVLLFDFQAHGESAGNHITFGYLESKDAQAAVAFLRQTLPGEQMGVIGVSMGGAAASLALPSLEVKAMVLESVYPTIDEAIADRLRMRLGGWAGILTPLLTIQFKPRLGCETNNLRPIDKVTRISTAKLFIFGRIDQHTTYNESMRLFNAAAEPKDYWSVDDAGHIDIHRFSKEEYEKRVLDFFRKYLN
jgi:fermentation-respiration switch protein FrsA (DUF1100 family)